MINCVTPVRVRHRRDQVEISYPSSWAPQFVLSPIKFSIQHVLDIKHALEIHMTCIKRYLQLDMRCLGNKHVSNLDSGANPPRTKPETNRSPRNRESLVNPEDTRVTCSGVCSIVALAYLEGAFAVCVRICQKNRNP